MVELIVVLVILAILAAILVPALLGWIDKAKEKQYVLDARSVYMAAQAKASELYAAQTTTPTAACSFGTQDVADIIKIADTGKSVDIGNITWNDANAPHGYYEIIGMTVKIDDHYCTLSGDSWTTTDTAPSGFTALPKA